MSLYMLPTENLHSLGHNGAFLHNNAVADDELHSHILDQNNQMRLWELSEQMVHEQFAL
jgi:hypothetical protein